MRMNSAMHKHPRVSIGMPVYNGGTLLSLAINSLVAQEFADFELIITDNASTDTTEAVCREFAARDPRITYIRRDKNYGANNNSVTAYKRSTGDYYMFTSHDDMWHPRFISECVKILDNNPQVVLAMPAIQFLSPDDGSFCDAPYPPLHTVGLGLRSMAAAIFNETNVGYSAYGLYRKEALSKIKIDIDCYGGDVIMLMQMVLLGEVAYLPQKLFYYRLSRKTAKDQMDSVRAIENEKKYTAKPYTSLTINLFRAIVNSTIDPCLKRIILSDALEIIAIKNRDWRNAVLSENKAIIPYIDPGISGFSSTAENNLIALFAGLLLPYCSKNSTYETMIDFSEIESFAAIPDKQKKPPVPGQKEFVETITNLAENNKSTEMLAYYDRYRQSLPDTENLVQLDAVLQRFRL
jgi:GT2 family glycosyltransferase